MSIQISLPPETEKKLRERAAAEGKEPAALVLEALEQKLSIQVGYPVPRMPKDKLAAWEKFVSGMLESTKNLPPGHHVDDSRESIYEGRDE